jgi:ribonuclease HII
MEDIFAFERVRSGDRTVVGIDEAGRGPLAGPVVAAAAAYRHQADFTVPESLENPFRFVRDSKKLSEKKREEMIDFIHERFVVGVGIVTAGTIDRMNILEATFLAMKEAVSDFRRKAKETGLSTDELLLLVDGNQAIPNLSVKQEAVVGGDASVKSVAAASIIAKVTRDRMMLGYDAEYPAYGFAKHKGYGTKAHMDALRRFGPCPIHRMSFRPVFLSIPENANRNLP